MSELQRLLTAYDRQRITGNPCALATVTEVEGSSYRRPGARMLVTDDGQLTGSISGGCLEGDALRRARRVMLTGKSEIIVYDSTDIEEDLQHGAQLGCEGTIHILLEPVDYADPNNPVELLRRTSRQDAPVVLVTILSAKNSINNLTGRRVLVANADKQRITLTEDSAADAQIFNDALGVLSSGQSLTQNYRINEGTVRLFLELILPAPQLTVYGVGNDAQPLVRLAVGLGWRVHVVDGRSPQATVQRFPEAESVQVVKLADLEKLNFYPGYAVLMSHNYHYDFAVLQQLVSFNPVNYIGILGPRKKTDRLLNDLAKAGVLINENENERLYGPVGLNIGAETAEEIAVAIMAELLAVRHQAKAGFLRELDGPIHNRNFIAATEN
ncbi:XdhC family protein [Mucilaginibacter arboris]|uniref:XdhC/CoxI family protein n=1 Tax=Mucilaginibacter arboris TaxID=2682090 RepID=A0A7K1SX43_9SPHI|nr:XdhC/CoxI family protein [Mucilaginibacter arboris]MVN21896.1 XdhC/CoxI family protein [Mucilaginibacter arboris]